MSRIEEIIETVGKSKIIGKLDMSKEYYQVKVQERDREKTATCMANWSSQCASSVPDLDGRNEQIYKSIHG